MLCLDGVLGWEIVEVYIVDAFLISLGHIDAINSNNCARYANLLLERLYLSTDRATYDLEACDVCLLTDFYSYGAVLWLEDLVLLLS